MFKTIQGNKIEIDGITEWVLFHRLSKKFDPVEFLTLTDMVIQYPNFLYTLSLVTILILRLNLLYTTVIPIGLCFFGHLVIKTGIGIGDFKLYKYPLLIFSKYFIFIILGAFVFCFFTFKWWGFLILLSYIIMSLIAPAILTLKHVKFYDNAKHMNVGVFQVVNNNSFKVVYKFLSKSTNLPKDINPSIDEIENKDWLKPKQTMKEKWSNFEKYFYGDSKIFWIDYLDINK